MISLVLYSFYFFLLLSQQYRPEHLICMLFMTSVINTMVHETGHFIGGILSQHHFLLIKTGPFLLVKDRFRRRFSFSFERSLYSQCIMIPDSSKYLLYNMGGILLNLITVIFSALCFMNSFSFFAFAMFITGINKVFINCLGHPSKHIRCDMKVVSEIISKDLTKSYISYMRAYEKYYLDIQQDSNIELSDDVYGRKLREMIDCSR